MKWLWRGLAALLVAGLVFAAGGLWNATRPPVVERVSLPLAGLERPVRVLLIADIHGGWPDMPAGRIAGIVDSANALRPDLILHAGDYFGGKLPDWRLMKLEDALDPLARLRAPLGNLASLGNHDEPYWTRRVMGLRAGPTLLVNDSRDLGVLHVAALDSMRYAPNLDRALATVPPDRPVLLLAHEPEQFVGRPMPDRAGTLLVLAGHTHGGQIVLPLMGSLGDRLLGPAPCRRGYCTLGDWRVFVTSGVGTSWVPLRYGVPPEMVLLTLVPDQDSGRKSGTER